jgi:hypothetical protein
MAYLEGCGGGPPVVGEPPVLAGGFSEVDIDGNVGRFAPFELFRVYRR